MKYLTIVFISTILLIGCTQNQTTENNISNFDTCIEAGNPIMESFPEQCSDGENTYTKDYTGEFCGGIAGMQCPPGYECQLDGDYPDAEGTCQQ